AIALFFFSSRRRHTIFSRDWSSDVCSSDLIAGWMNRHQQAVIEYLMEENRVLREQIGRRRMRFDDDQRRRLAAKAKRLGRKLLRSEERRVGKGRRAGWELGGVKNAAVHSGS